MHDTETVRLVEVLSALSLALDVTEGQPSDMRCAPRFSPWRWPTTSGCRPTSAPPFSTRRS